MNEKQKANIYYKKNRDEIKEFEVEFEISSEKKENNDKLIELLDHPIKLIINGGQIGVKGVKRFFFIIFLFIIVNITLFIYALTELFSADFDIGKIPYVFAVFLLGLGTTIYTGYVTYPYVIIDTFRVIYENSTSLFKKIATLIIDALDKSFKGKADITDYDFEKVLNIGDIVNSGLKTLPVFLRKGIINILKKIPFAAMLVELKDDIMSGNKEEASKKLFYEMDRFLTKYIFGMNNTNFVFQRILPVNIIALIILIKWKIG